VCDSVISCIFEDQENAGWKDCGRSRMSIKRHMHQTAVYWAPANTESGGRSFDNYGSPLYASPVEKTCRWEDTVTIFVGITGTEESSKAVVMIDDVLVGGLLMLGTLSDVTDLADPRNNIGAWEIRQKEKIPNLRNTITYEWAYL